MAESNYDALARLLGEIYKQHGPQILTERRRLVAMLSDLLPAARREIRVLSQLIDDGVFEALSGARPDQLALQIDRLATRAETNQATRHDVALATVRAAAHGLGLGPLPSACGAVSTATATAAPPPPKPQPAPVTAASDASWIEWSRVEPESAAANGTQGEAPAARQPRGISGWLVVPLAGLVIICLNILHGVFVRGYAQLLISDAFWSKNVGRGDWLGAAVVFWQAGGSAYLLYLASRLGWQFMRKTRRTPSLFIFWSLAFVVYQAAFIALLAARGLRNYFDLATGGLLLAIAFAAFIVPYFRRSRRVRNTFVG